MSGSPRAYKPEKPSKGYPGAGLRCSGMERIEQEGTPVRFKHILRWVEVTHDMSRAQGGQCSEWTDKLACSLTRLLICRGRVATWDSKQRLESCAMGGQGRLTTYEHTPSRMEN